MSLQNFKKFAEGKEFRPEGPRFATTTHNSGTIYVNKRGAASTIAPPMKQHSVAKAITLSPVGRMGTPKKAPGSKDVSFFSRFRREETIYEMGGGGGGAGGGAGGAANAGSGSQVGAPTNNASGGYIAGMGYKNPSVPGQGRVGVDMRKHKHKILTRKIGVKPKMAGKFMLP